MRRAGRTLLLHFQRPRWWVILLTALIFIFLSLYPNPMLLARAIPNAYNPDIDPEAVQHWADVLPDDPEYIEQQVLDKYVPYEVPWETHGVPWYFPTTREVVEQGSGDCQSRMIVLASILEAKGIPYTIQASFDHIWVKYDKKAETRLENNSITILEGGNVQVPSTWDWRESYRIEKDYFWDRMPDSRKVILFGGLFVILFWRVLVRGLIGLYRYIVQRTRQDRTASEPVAEQR